MVAYCTQDSNEVELSAWQTSILNVWLKLINIFWFGVDFSSEKQTMRLMNLYFMKTMAILLIIIKSVFDHRHSQ